MARELFVYWKLDAVQAASATLAAAQMQRLLQQEHPALQARLYRRSGVRDGLVTLMETYAQHGGVDDDLQAAIEDAAGRHLQAWCQGPRQVEVFELLAGCCSPT